MKTFLVEVYIPVFARVEVEANNIAEANAKAAETQFSANQLKVFLCDYAPDQVLGHETREK